MAPRGTSGDAFEELHHTALEEVLRPHHEASLLPNQLLELLGAVPDVGRKQCPTPRMAEDDHEPGAVPRRPIGSIADPTIDRQAKETARCGRGSERVFRWLFEECRARNQFGLPHPLDQLPWLHIEEEAEGIKRLGVQSPKCSTSLGEPVRCGVAEVGTPTERRGRDLPDLHDFVDPEPYHCLP